MENQGKCHGGKSIWVVLALIIRSQDLGSVLQRWEQDGYRFGGEGVDEGQDVAQVYWSSESVIKVVRSPGC